MPVIPIIHFVDTQILDIDIEFGDFLIVVFSF